MIVSLEPYWQPHPLLVFVVIFIIVTLGQWVGWVVLKPWSRLPPGPFPIPILGNILHIAMSPLPHRSLAILGQRYGPVLFLRMGSTPTIVVSSPNVARYIFHTHDKVFAGRPHTQTTEHLFYGGDKAAFTSSYGSSWMFVRKLYTTHILGITSRHIQQLHFPIIVDEARHLVRRIYTSNSRDTVPIDLTSCIYTLAEDIICRLVLRQRAHDLMSPMASSEGGHGGHLSLAKFIEEGASLWGAGLMGDTIPLLSFLDYTRKRAMNKWFLSFDAILEPILSRREVETEAEVATRVSNGHANDPPPPKDILDVFLACDPPLHRDMIKEMMLELLMGGIGTLAITLDWAMAEILANPRVLRKLQEESDNVVGKERMVEMEDLPKLPYMKAVVKETLRKHPPVPFLLPHMSMEACELSVNEGGVGPYRIPKGTTMLMNVWAIGNDPTTWEFPDKFLPERFMVGGCTHTDVRGQHFELLPFGGGRRICPSIGLALAIVEVCVACLTHCFEWAIDGVDVDMTEEFGMSIPRKAPLFAVPGSFRITKFDEFGV